MQWDVRRIVMEQGPIATNVIPRTSARQTSFIHIISNHITDGLANKSDLVPRGNFAHDMPVGSGNNFT